MPTVRSLSAVCQQSVSRAGRRGRPAVGEWFEHRHKKVSCLSYRAPGGTLLSLTGAGRATWGRAARWRQPRSPALTGTRARLMVDAETLSGQPGHLDGARPRAEQRRKVEGERERGERDSGGASTGSAAPPQAGSVNGMAECKGNRPNAR